MQREIKFRAWNETGKEMIPFEWLEIYYEGARIVDEEAHIYDASNMPLMQFTGLKDKNGKDIYEGDIVKGVNLNSEAVFDQGSFAIKNSAGSISLREFSDNYFEVIGNKWENPELIK